MNKAKEWIVKYSSKDEFIGQYAEETAKLVAERTAKSTEETRLGAAEGAIRQQKDKWRAICNSVKELNENTFELMIVDLAIPEYKNWKAKAAVKQTKPKNDDVAEYRKQKRR